MKITNDSIDKAIISFGRKGWSRTDRNLSDNEQPEFVLMLDRGGNPKDGDEFVYVKTSFRDLIDETIKVYLDLAGSSDRGSGEDFITDSRILIWDLQQAIKRMQLLMDQEE